MTDNFTRTRAADALRSAVPIVEWLPKYKKKWFRPDLIAALTVWALLVPEAMAYATLAGLPPEAGLYAAPLALIGYAIFGTSRQLVVGPSSTMAVMSAVVVGTFAVSGTEEYIALSAALALVVGALFVVAGLFKLGFLADFMSRPILSGLVVGIAVTIVMGQLDKILGYSVPESGGFIEESLYFIRDIGQIHWVTLIIGGISLYLDYRWNKPRFLIRNGEAAPEISSGLSVSSAWHCRFRIARSSFLRCSHHRRYPRWFTTTRFAERHYR